MEFVYRILQYLKHDPGKGLLFRKNTNNSLEVYTDANWLDLLLTASQP